MTDILNNILDRLSPNELHRLGFTANIYIYDYPVKPRTGEKARFWKNTVSHVGNQKNALDFIIPHPIEKGPLPIIMPVDGTIIELIQNNDKYGNDPEYAKYTNQIIGTSGKNEVFRIAHIGIGSCPYRVGETVKRGEQIATTGVNGWMTDARHSHFEVGTTLNGKYETLKVRWSGV